MSTTATEATAAPEAAASDDHEADAGSKQLDEALREEITPIAGATVVKAGGRTAEATTAKEPTARKASTRKTTRKATTRKATGGRKTTARKTTTSSVKKISSLAAAETVLKRAGGPLHVNEITKRILAMPNTGLKGKTPTASVGAMLAVNSKKRGSIFKRTAPSTYTVKEKS